MIDRWVRKRRVSLHKSKVSKLLCEDGIAMSMPKNDSFFSLCVSDLLIFLSFFCSWRGVICGVKCVKCLKCWTSIPRLNQWSVWEDEVRSIRRQTRTVQLLWKRSNSSTSNGADIKSEQWKFWASKWSRWWRSLSARWPPAHKYLGSFLAISGTRWENVPTQAHRPDKPNDGAAGPNPIANHLK